MKRILSLLALVLCLSALSGVAQADTLVFTTTLTGANEVPPVSSPGIGNAVVTVVDGNTMNVGVIFSGLSSPTTASHIHCCTPPGANAMVATTTPTFPGFPLGVLAGSYSQTFDLNLPSTYNPAFITAQGGTVAGARAALLTGLEGGLTYFNIHTQAFPGGEIRGQLHPIPEPATLILLGTGLAGIAAKVRKRRKS